MKVLNQLRDEGTRVIRIFAPNNSGLTRFLVSQAAELTTNLTDVLYLTEEGSKAHIECLEVVHQIKRLTSETYDPMYVQEVRNSYNYETPTVGRFVVNQTLRLLEDCCGDFTVLSHSENINEATKGWLSTFGAEVIIADDTKEPEELIKLIDSKRTIIIGQHSELYKVDIKDYPNDTVMFMHKDKMNNTLILTNLKTDKSYNVDFDFATATAGEV